METLGYDKFGRPILNEGKGSGNFGHSGRPGLQGGSVSKGASGKSGGSSKKFINKRF